jgi:hypothetical protein
LAIAGLMTCSPTSAGVISLSSCRRQVEMPYRLALARFP